MKTEQPLMFIPDFMIVLKHLETSGEKDNTEIWESTKITYAHLHKILQIFVKKDWVTKNKVGIRAYYKITKTGLEFVQVIDILLEKLGINDKNILEFRKQHKRNSVKLDIEEPKEEVVLEEEEVDDGRKDNETY